MPVRSRIASFVRNLTRRRRLEQELADEVSAYVELSTAKKIKEGLNETDARRAALVNLGGAEQVKELVRDVRAGHFVETRVQDLRFAFRTLRKSPVFALTVTLVLALSIGSTTLMFAIVNSVLLEGPRFPEADRLVTLWQRIPQEPRVAFSPKEFTAWQKQTEVFENLSFVTGTGFTISGRGDPDLVIGRMVTPAFFRVLKVNPVLGRAFTEAESADRVVVLSYALWRDKFGQRSEILGESVTMNGEPYTVLGVLPETFDFEGPDAKLFVPASLSSPIFNQHPDAHFLRVFGRLKPGVTRSQ
ncbi:MAG TPA: ABC transporter permease [Chthoniobacterales bacterium]